MTKAVNVEDKMYTVENVCDFTIHYSINCNVKLQSEHYGVKSQ